MLNEKEKGIIKETVPVLQEKGTEITSYFTIECLINIQN